MVKSSHQPVLSQCILPFFIVTVQWLGSSMSDQDRRGISLWIAAVIRHRTSISTSYHLTFDPPHKTRHEYVNMLVSFLFDSLLLAVISASWSLPQDNNSLLIALSLASKLWRRRMDRMCYENKDVSVRINKETYLCVCVFLCVCAYMYIYVYTYIRVCVCVC